MVMCVQQKLGISDYKCCLNAIYAADTGVKYSTPDSDKDFIGVYNGVLQLVHPVDKDTDTVQQKEEQM